ncbi:hypothetical protein B0I72DRAFT_141355 [Yarrowia lipolytica]|uniref:Uncharacterized protein n=1 Tax=Yarrowia lipolytica TaxID=4952 RepID=A0A371BY23_YARLL|nr:hypothetical protein B0I71DRAFT_136663 [Yarrowia lipolytica]RDW30531.1 hypothetical protein B0I72DRAFT_141355 [Yarrowia lipolytica]RDW36483.1 hypothetical protein B0I73DRAFT_137046 [Yarrowia lipolytica]RDW45149.1 hypothetical protein B0I74DRAFT_139196 [Yarrowia lipolytica]RDW51837.1 hypothetical protein B0I75DRAFT_139159 [Yarrowia lipolytica]
MGLIHLFRPGFLLARTLPTHVLAALSSLTVAAACSLGVFAHSMYIVRATSAGRRMTGLGHDVLFEISTGTVCTVLQVAHERPWSLSHMRGLVFNKT